MTDTTPPPFDSEQRARDFLASTTKGTTEDVIRLSQMFTNAFVAGRNHAVYESTNEPSNDWRTDMELLLGRILLVGEISWSYQVGYTITFDRAGVGLTDEQFELARKMLGASS